jgi:carnitine-CoA ligase
MTRALDTLGPPQDRAADADLRLLTVPQLVDRAAALWPDREAVVFDATGERLTFAELRAATLAYAAALYKQGVRQDDRVAVMLRNSLAFPLCWLALARLGATLVPVNVYAQAGDLRHVVGHSGARLVITAEEFVETIAGALADEAEATQIVLATDLAQDGGEASADEAFDGSGVTVDTVLNVQYTSGSTGLPKGCMLSHGYWSRIGWKLCESFPHVGPADRIITAQPFYYIDPQVSVIIALSAGATVIALDRFHPTTIWSKIREHRATLMYCVGVMPTMMLRVPPDERDRDHQLRVVSCSAIPRDRHAEIEARWGVPWSEAFGMTETGSDTFVSPEEHDALVGSGCIGRPFPDREARVVGDDGQELPAGETGHFELRGPGMMSGYLDDPEATAAAFNDGWFRTGDLARITDDGLIYYAGRAKDIIRRSGENISALEVEEAILQLPGVQLAACIAVADEVRGEEIKAYVVPKQGEELDLDAGVASLRARLAYFKVPRYWAIRDELPLTASAKVHKAALRAETPAIDDRTIDVGSPRRS